MLKKSDKQDLAREKAVQLLEEAEEKRAVARFERGLVELESGRFLILKNKEFVEKLALYLYEQYLGVNRENAETLLKQLFSQMTPEQKNIRDPLSILENVGQTAITESNLPLIQFLCKRYSKVLKNDSCEILLSAEVCQFFSKAGTLFVRNNLWEEFDNLVETLWPLRKISFETIAGPVVPIPEILESMGTKTTIEKILKSHKTGDETIRDRSQKYITYFGNRGAAYLLNKLIDSVTKEERFLLMEIICSMGDVAKEYVAENLSKDLPWYAIRNMVYIIAELKDPENHNLVERYLEHPDIRVQQQVVASIIKQGGPDLGKRLVHALGIIHDEIKMKLVMQLGAFSSEEISDALLELLAGISRLNAAMRNELSFRICVSLRSYPYPKVVKRLKKYLRKHKHTLGNSDKTILAIDETINILEPKIRHSVKGENCIVDDISYINFTSENGAPAEGLDRFLKEINALMVKGEKEKASNIIYRKILESARSKDFDTAELLRDKLLDVNPEALQDVLRAAEIIEEERHTPVADHHIEIWEELYEYMSTEEFDGFYYSLQQENYSHDEVIVSAGEVDPCLYFINSGSVQISCDCGGEETFLKKMKPGDVIGIAQFFSVSVWTVNLTAQKDCQVHVLTGEGYAKVISNFPDIEEKLKSYCMKKEDVPRLVKMSGKDRRDNARYPVNVTVNNILLDSYGGNTGSRIFQGEMLDISMGGLSFSIRISAKENANLLLGRQIMSEINFQGKEVLKCFGVIVGVRYLSEIVKEFSVHVKFYSTIKEVQVTEILSIVV